LQRRRDPQVNKRKRMRKARGGGKSRKEIRPAWAAACSMLASQGSRCIWEQGNRIVASRAYADVDVLKLPVDTASIVHALSYP
jgi:hypothetical protein